jgi:hypothetical protein
MTQRYNGIEKDLGGIYVLHEDYEELRLLLAEVILRFSVFDGEFMTRLVDKLEEG